MDIRQLMNQQGVAYLTHFTQASNLNSIFVHGLRSTSYLKSKNITFDKADDKRLDERTEYICTSIEFPNYLMFYRLRNRFPDCDWVILGITADVLFEQKCLFCRENAASSEIRRKKESELSSTDAFDKMFKNYPEHPRSTLKIPDWYPTNPQAEVLVYDKIPANKINYVAFEDEHTRIKYSSIVPSSITTLVLPKMFEPRCDWMHWTSEKKEVFSNG